MSTTASRVTAALLAAVTLLPRAAAAADPRRDTPSEGLFSEFDHFVEASLAVDSGSLPGRQALGVEVGAHLRSRLLGARFTVLAFPEKRLAPTSDDGSAFSLFGAAAAGCLSSTPDAHKAPIAFLLCGGFEAGRLHGRGYGVNRPTAESSPWLAPRADASIFFGPETLRGFARLGGGWPLVRRGFRLGGGDALHQAEALTWRANLGLAF